MKTHLMVVAALLAASCQPSLDISVNTRSSHYVKTTFMDGETGEKPERLTGIDTTVYFSAVDFPSNYDWKRDSACGSSSATLLIYRNFEVVGSFETGESSCIGTDPDTHHWLNGNLYTEYNLYDKTVIKKNGEELFRYDGREFLKGLLEVDGDVWTLGQDCSGNGFSLRCNGDEVIKRTAGRIFGDLSSSIHEGLYIDLGKICFCYVRETSSTNNLYKFIDSKETLHTSRSQYVHDMRIINGDVSIVQSTSEFTLYEKAYSVFQIGEMGIKVDAAWLCRNNPGALVCLALTGNGEQDYCIWEKGNPQSIGRGWQLYMYPREGESMKYVRFSGAEMHLCDILDGELAGFAKPEMFSRSCLQFVGDNYFLAHNGSGNSGVRIMTKGKSIPVQVNGYISGLEVTLQKKEED